jgi:hypothetical protein
MHALSAADILHVWEVGRGQSHVERAVTLLERAYPETDRAALVHLSLGARDRLLLEVRAGVLGEALEVTTVCPACDERLEFRLAIGDLLGGESISGVAQTGDPCSARESTEFEMAVAGYELRFRLLDSADLLAAAACPDAEAARSALVARCLLAALRSGDEVAVADLPPEVVAALAERLAEGDAQIETMIDITCPVCAGTCRAELDLAGFIWEEIRGQAQRLLEDVDALARAYGWSEAEILALGTERRRLYLERVL